jgi:hypothetical protein
MKKKAIFLCLLVSLLFSVDALAQYYSWDYTAEPWGWAIRKSTYENGTVKWELRFGLYYSSDNQTWNKVTWDDIEKVILYKFTGVGFNPVSFSRSNEHDEYYRLFLGDLDYYNSWLVPDLKCPELSFECPLDIHESVAEISKFDEPKLNEVYKLEITLKNYPNQAVSYLRVPKTMNLKPIPLQTAKTIINKNGKVVTTGDMVPAISIKESDDGSLVVQYIAPFIESEPPAIQDDVFAPDAWLGTHIRVGIALSQDFGSPENPLYYLYPAIPSNVGTVVFPKELVNFMKNQKPRFTGTVYFRILHRDALKTTMWCTGDEGVLPYTFLNPDPIND